MPATIPSWAQHAIEGTMLLIFSVVALISEQDWGRLLGPHGVAVAALMAVVALWLGNIRDKRILREDLESRERREENRRAVEEASREKRHTESIRIQRENADKLIALTVENIKAAAHVTASIESVDRTIQTLADELKDRPCQAIGFKKPSP